jgi:hypothetical protein
LFREPFNIHVTDGRGEMTCTTRALYKYPKMHLQTVTTFNGHILYTGDEHNSERKKESVEELSSRIY